MLFSIYIEVNTKFEIIIFPVVINWPEQAEMTQ